MKKVISIAVSLVVLIGGLLCLAGCSEADRVNSNISKQADYFESERRVTVYNARTDKIIMYIEGYISISNNSTNELVVIAKVGGSTYKKNYVVEDISGTHTDPYHYKVYFDVKLPDVEVK